MAEIGQSENNYTSDPEGPDSAPINIIRGIAANNISENCITNPSNSRANANWYPSFLVLQIFLAAWRKAAWSDLIPHHQIPQLQSKPSICLCIAMQAREQSIGCRHLPHPKYIWVAEGKNRVAAVLAFSLWNVSLGTWHQLEIPDWESRICQLSCTFSQRSVTVVSTNLVLYKYQTVLENKHLLGTWIPNPLKKLCQKHLNFQIYQTVLITIMQAVQIWVKRMSRTSSNINWIPAHTTYVQVSGASWWTERRQETAEKAGQTWELPIQQNNVYMGTWNSN